MRGGNGTAVRETVFLFGAGASHGARDIIPEQPPLGPQLYGVLAHIYPNSWGRLPDNAQERFERGNFEDGMEVIYEKYSHIIPELMRQLSVYIIQFRPNSGRSLYCRLIRYLRKNDLLQTVLFSTLNYDCILEFSMLRQGVGISYFDEGDTDRVPVWKLHGSCNMFSRNVRATSGVHYTKDVVFEGRLEAWLDIGTVVEKCLVNQGLAPAMCLYMRDKPLQISPSVIEQLQRSWRESILKAKNVFCIGVNPLSEDQHVWGPLGEMAGHLCFIGNEQAFRKWVGGHRTGPSEFLGRYFHESFSELERRLGENEPHRG